MTIRIKTNACFEPIGFFAGRACRRPQTGSGEHQPTVVDVGARDLDVGGEAGGEAWAHSLLRQQTDTGFKRKFGRQCENHVHRDRHTKRQWV